MATYSITNSNSSIVDKSIFGGKAHWLSWLIQNGYNVPDCFFISAIDKNEVEKVIEQLKNDVAFQIELVKFEIANNNFDVAIRSSALDEDSAEKSFAGHFKSFVDTVSYEQIFTNIENVVRSTGNQKMGVVVQKKINSKFSGVIFSSNPLTASKNEMLISIVEGMGENLVSGKVSGEDILVNNNTGFAISKYNTSVKEELLLQLCTITKEIENKVNFPVDVEWSIDNTDKLYIVQCRPVTTIFPKHIGIIPIDIANSDLIPEQLKGNDKVKIRLIAQQNNIDISNAYLVVNNNSSIIDEVALSKIQPQERCKGYSLVLIFPKTISGNIIRHFTENEHKKQNTAFRTCQRYNVRSYQDYSSLSNMLQSIQSKCCEASWFCVTIIQEIFEPLFTGIAKKIDNGFLVEIAKGHFVPKGIVPISQYILDNKNEVVFKNEIVQDIAYKILHGTVSKENINTLISVDNDTLAEIIKQLMPLLSAGVQAVEFGLLKDKQTNKISPYIIDLVDDNNSTDLSSKLIAEGVISTGIRSGKVKILNIKDLGQNSLELHFHNSFENKNTIDEDIIFVAETPDIALLEILKQYNNSKIGFIFREGSALSHLSIVLREKKIPAIVVGNQINLIDNMTVKIDASAESHKGLERISFGTSSVTSYVNPDLDGIASSIVYAFYKTQKGENYTPVYFGQLDNESIFALNYFKFEFPKQVSDVDGFDKIIIVDTHNPIQLSKSISFDKIVEILDHHSDGSLETFPNAQIRNEKIGAVCTMIAEQFKNEKICVPENIAGLLSLGIISNTLNFTAPSTNSRDVDAHEWLKLFVCISDDVITRLFESRSSIDNIESQNVIANNMKEFCWSKTKVGISQIEMINVSKLIERADFANSLVKIKNDKELDYIIFSGVDILLRNTYILVPDNDTLEIINKSMGYNFISTEMLVDKILLRKTDFIPKLKTYFETV
jgi:manganese-dependent inorganic pyrophosphatase